MDYTLLASWGFGVLSILCLGLFLYGLHYGIAQTPWPDRRKRRTLIYFAVGLIAWLGISGTLAYKGFFSDFSSVPPRMFINLVIPALAIVLLIGRPATREILDGIPPYWLIAFQSFRIPVELLLWGLFIGGSLPEQLTFEGYNFDVLSGIFGVLLAILLYWGIRHPFRWIRIYNFVGLALLLTILTLAILSMPTPFRQFMNEPPNTIVANFPIVWLPAFLVPLALSLHLLSLKQTQ